MARKLAVVAAIAGALLMPAAPLAAYGGGGGQGGIGGTHGGFRAAHGGFRGGHGGGHSGWHGAHFGAWQSVGRLWHGRWWSYGFDPCWEWTTSGWLWTCY
jgi:hypothetical protein